MKILILALVLCFIGLSIAGQVSVNKANVVARHNKVRSAYKLAGLKWSGAIASSATSYSTSCKWQHAKQRKYGENLGCTTSGDVVGSSMTMWFNEKRFWNCRTNRCQSGKVCGHFTQVVWGTSRQIGCGGTNCGRGTPFSGYGNNWLFFVCRYYPPGNYVGKRPFAAAKC